MVVLPFPEKISETQGFTLIEIMVSLAILGGGMFLLMNAHYSALQLHMLTEEEVDSRMLLESSVARAEMGIAGDELSGSGDFGTRYSGFSWSYEAQELGDTENPFLMDMQFLSVTVTLTVPQGDAKTLSFRTFRNPELQTIPVVQ
jgi:prepilin-type N-terminal cleavage/methylation domain-containing protein